jgi:Rhodopirellula transposase DDE domain
VTSRVAGRSYGMRMDPEVRDHIAGSFFTAMSPCLDEKLLRLSAGALALAFGEGSARAVAAAAGLSGSTVGAGMRDVVEESAPVESTRRTGAGRRGIELTYPELWPALDALIEPEERGDPQNPLRWTVKSTRTLADELVNHGFDLCHTTVGRLLREHGYSLRGTAKVLEGTAAHGEDRDRQFRHINDTTRAFLAQGQPVISVDTKKKEPIGNFERPGRTWRPYQDPVKVEDHSFAEQMQTIAVPHGIYDIGADRGFVNVGIGHDTPTFAIASIRRWWNELGRAAYPRATRLLIVADSGGSNSTHSLAFKVPLHRFALEIGIEITMAHLPPGTSKWNKVEHRLFAQVSSNWRGRPLTSIEVVVSLIATTTTSTGLSVQCMLDENDYPTGVTGSWDQVDALPITFHAFRGAWNYTIAPTPADPANAQARAKHKLPGQPAKPKHSSVTLLGDAVERAAWITHLSAPEITGIKARAWTKLTARLEASYQELREQEATAARGGRPSAHPGRHDRALKIPFTQLMLATVLHERYQLPIAQISRLIDLNYVSVGKHVARLAPLFAEHGHALTPVGDTITKLEHLYKIAALPQDRPATREVTT